MLMSCMLLAFPFEGVRANPWRHSRCGAVEITTTNQLISVRYSVEEVIQSLPKKSPVAECVDSWTRQHAGKLLSSQLHV